MRGRETFEHGFVQNKFKSIEIEESNEMFVSCVVWGGKRRRRGGGIKGLRGKKGECEICDIVGM